VGAVLCLAFAVAFTVRVAGPNVVGSGQKVAEKTAVWTLRNLIWAQDLLVRHRGRVGVFGELAGTRGVGGQPPLEAPLVREPFAALQAGPHGQVADFSGYEYAIWVEAAGGPPATDGSGTPAPAARRWVAYAWPTRRGPSGLAAFCIDQDENILETHNDAPGQGYDGLTKVPAWDACLTAAGDGLPANGLEPGTGRDGGAWQRWQGRPTKRAREAHAQAR
jgi:hypothetical protein